MASKQARRDSSGKFVKGSSGNPAGRPRTSRTPPEIRWDQIASALGVREDGWNNIITGLGLASRDNRESTSFYADIVTDGLANELWRGDDVAARIIEAVPDDMFREGFEVTLQTEDEDDAKPNPFLRTDEQASKSKNASEDIASLWDDLDATEKFKQAIKYERAKAGGAIMIGVEDNTGRVALPLDPSTATIRGIKYLTVYEKKELTPERWYTNPFEDKFGEVELWRVSPIAPGGASESSFLVHESRMIVFGGIKVTRDQIGTHSGFGDSVLTRVWRVLRDFNTAYSGASALVNDFSVAVHKIAGLAELVVHDNVDAIQNRLQAIHMARAITGTTIIDSEEEYGRHTTPITGLPDLLDRFGVRLAAAAEMPLTRLMGMSPGGLNATGESDVRFYYDTLQTKRTGYTKQVNKLIRVLMTVLKIAEPKKWSIEWGSLWQESDKESADARKVQAETDAIYIQNGVLSPDTIAMNRYGGDKYSFETVIDVDEYKADLEAASELETEIDPNAPVDPNAPAPPAAGDVQKTAMNGAQVTSMVDVISQANEKKISRESAKGILMIAFRLSDEDAESVLGPEDFEPPKPEPPTFPGAPAPGKPPMPGEPKPPMPPDKPDISKQIGNALDG